MFRLRVRVKVKVKVRVRVRYELKNSLECVLNRLLKVFFRVKVGDRARFK